MSLQMSSEVNPLDALATIHNKTKDTTRATQTRRKVIAKRERGLASVAQIVRNGGFSDAPSAIYSMLPTEQEALNTMSMMMYMGTRDNLTRACTIG